MASVPDLAPFLRKPRMGVPQKVRPVMKLEWNKLLAEATEKDVELKKDSIDDEVYYDDDSEFTGENESNVKTNSEENQEGKPLNLCSKSHTLPGSSISFQKNIDILDLSAKKVMPENKNVRKSSEFKKNSNSSSFSNFQLNDFSNEKIIKETTSNNSKEVQDCNVENKENFNSNYLKNIYCTPSNTKPPISEHNGKNFQENDLIKSCKVKDVQNKPNLIFYSEKKLTSKNALLEKLVV